MTYATNSIKQDPVSGMAASRTGFDENGQKAWRVFGPNEENSWFVSSADIAQWVDLAPVESAPPGP